MITFEDFARAHGLVLHGLVSDKWVAVPTDDHPRKKNGRYKWLGDVGWVQNWATMDKPAMWRGESVSTVDLRKRVAENAADRQRAADAAAKKAAWIMHQTESLTHPYLERKGFPDEVGNVWRREEGDLLVVPMRVKDRLVGCQLIGQEGEKKFLSGQQTKGAAFVLNAKGTPIFCEGYATALSIRAAMKAMKIRYTIHVCFSAANVKEVAGAVDGGIVVADNDVNGVGERFAGQTGKPYWLSDAVGEDFNDFYLRVGIFQASLSLKQTLLGAIARVGGTSPR